MKTQPARISLQQSSSILFIGCVLAAGLGLCGCSRGSAKSWRVTGGSISQRDNGTLVSYCIANVAREEHICMVVVANGSAGSNFRGGEGNFQGEFLARDGANIPWSCVTQDGQGGKVLVAGQEFDLSRGALFLVSVKEKPARVDQLAVDAAQLQTCSDGKNFLALAKADPRTASFLKSCAENERPGEK